MKTLISKTETSSRSQWTYYTVAIACTVLALPIIFFREGPAAELNLRLLLLAGVMFSSWFGGLGPGLLTTAITSVAIQYSSPPSGFWEVDSDHLVRLIEFVIVALLITFLNDRRRRAQRRAELAQMDAQSANRAKDEFLATVSHELRTPLTSVLGWANVLQSGQTDRELTDRGLEAIQRNARKQQELIDDLLDISRITSGQLRLDTCPTDLGKVIHEAVDVVRPAINAKGLRIHTSLPEKSFNISADNRRMQQVIWNLLSNAVKFTPEGGVILVQLEYSDLHARIVVADNGSGIATDLLPHIFERFRQGEGSGARQGGVGLGLAIARELVELHGGTIEARNSNDGGAEFTIRLPLAIANRELRPVKSTSAIASATLS